MPGPVSEMAGSSTCLNAVVASPLDVLEVTHYPHVIGDDLTTETGINTTGAAVAWVADRLYGGRTGRAKPADYLRLDAEASVAPHGADGLLFVPVLGGGERTDATLRGAITGLSLRHDRAAIARAVLEGVAFAIRPIDGLHHAVRGDRCDRVIHLDVANDRSGGGYGGDDDGQDEDRGERRSHRGEYRSRARAGSRTGGMPGRAEGTRHEPLCGVPRRRPSISRSA